MAFYLMGPIEAETVRWLSLKKLVYEVCRFHGPPIWYVYFFEVYLLLENLVANVFASLACVGASSKHELVSDNTKGEVVDLDSVILPTHHFGSHIAGRS